jgi:hypothetical protein
MSDVMAHLDATIGREDIQRVLEQHADGRRAPRPRLPDIERRSSVRHITDLSRRVPVADMERLAEATERREACLRLAREGDLAAADEGLAAVERFVDTEVETLEGQRSAASFHAAAVAFSEFRHGRLGAAEDELRAALALCRTLAVEHGHDVGVRRVHLARNVARLWWSDGRHLAAAQLVLELLHLVWQPGRPWPLGPDTALPGDDRDRLRDDERWFLTDQLLSEAVALTTDPARSPADAAALAAVLAPARDDAELPAPVVRVLAILRCAVAASALEVLAAMGEHVAYGPQHLPMSFDRLEGLFERMTGTSLA